MRYIYEYACQQNLFVMSNSLLTLNYQQVYKAQCYIYLLLYYIILHFNIYYIMLYYIVLYLPLYHTVNYTHYIILYCLTSLQTG